MFIQTKPPLVRKHRENRKTLPFKNLFGCQYVKVVFTKNFTITTVTITTVTITTVTITTVTITTVTITTVTITRGKFGKSILFTNG